MHGAASFLLTLLLLPEPRPTPSPLARGEKLLEQKQYAKAEAELRQAVADDPKSARAHGNLALALLPQKKTREAVDEARLAAAFGPDSPEARYIFGLALSADGRPVEAARQLEVVVGLRPSEAGPLAALAAAYAATGDERTAVTYERLIRLKPGDPRPRAELAEYLWRTEKNDEGNRAIEEAMKAFPSNADLAARYGRALAQQDRAVDAAAALEAARRLGSTEAATFALLASSYERANKPEAARAVLADGVAARPDDASLQHDLGRLLLADGRPEEALPHLQKAAGAPRATAGAELDLGRALEALGRADEAEIAYRRAIRLSPDLAGAHYALGKLLQRQGKKAEAERELETHHRLYERGRETVSAANSRTAELAFAWAELNQGKAASALARFEALPESPDALWGRALALSSLERHPEAVLALERALELEPDDHRVELLLVTERSRAEEKK